MRKDELDLIQLLSAAPVLNGITPAMTAVAEAMDKNDSCRMPANGRENKGSGAANGSHCFCLRRGSRRETAVERGEVDDAGVVADKNGE